MNVSEPVAFAIDFIEYKDEPRILNFRVVVLIGSYIPITIAVRIIKIKHVEALQKAFGELQLFIDNYRLTAMVLNSARIVDFDGFVEC